MGLRPSCDVFGRFMGPYPVEKCRFLATRLEITLVITHFGDCETECENGHREHSTLSTKLNADIKAVGERWEGNISRLWLEQI